VYKLFLDLTDFLAACWQAGAVVTLQPVQKGRQHTIPYVEASLLLTAAVPQPAAGDPPLLAARVVIEETQMWSDDEAERTALLARTKQADTLLCAACTAAGVPVAVHDGILAAPGLMTDLWQISATHAVWRIARPDPTRSAAWTLQPRPAVTPAEAGNL